MVRAPVTLAEQMLDEAPTAMVALDTSLRILAANRAFATLVEVSQNGLRNAAARDILEPSLPELFVIIERLSPTGQTSVRTGLVGAGRLNGMHLMCDVSNVRHPGAAPWLYIGLENVTDRFLNDQRLRAAADELTRSNRDLEDFAAVASHDLQEPVRKMRAFGERLTTRLGATLDPTSRDYLDRMTGAAIRMSALIDAVLAYSRIGSQQLSLETVDLAALVAEVARSLPAARISAEGLPQVRADRRQFELLFANLIGNAVKYCRPGEEPSVRVSAERAAASWTVRVSDNGIGFAPEYHEKIFKMFQRLHGRDAFTGTGIGLTICRRIMERHGGTIHAESAPGHGATFSIDLPDRR